MSTTITAPSKAPLNHGELRIAHLTYNGKVAICGKRLLDLPPPPGCEICVVCEALWAERRGAP